MTLNVYSVVNKQLAVEQYLKANRVQIAVITETHQQEGERDTINIKGYKLVSSRSRQKEEKKGGVAIFLYLQISCMDTEHRVAQEESELEYCSATVFPNHNNKDQLVIVGVYRPPYKKHPPYDQAIFQMLKANKEKKQNNDNPRRF